MLSMLVGGVKWDGKGFVFGLLVAKRGLENGNFVRFVGRRRKKGMK